MEINECTPLHRWPEISLLHIPPAPRISSPRCRRGTPPVESSPLAIILWPAIKNCFTIVCEINYAQLSLSSFTVWGCLGSAGQFFCSMCCSMGWNIQADLLTWLAVGAAAGWGSPGAVDECGQQFVPSFHGFL